MGNSKICGNCKKFGSYKTDDGRHNYCEEPKIYDLFRTEQVLYDFGCIWFEKQKNEEDEE